MTLTVDDCSLEDLATRAQRGDVASFEQLVMRLRAPLVAFLARRLTVPNDADDVAQETFNRAYRNLASYDPTRKFSTWLFAIGKHAASNFARAQQRREQLERRIEPDAEPATASADQGSETWQRARKLLGDDAYRALWLRYARDFTVREVARELGKTVVGTKVMLFRARAKLLEEAM
jgi:RNA polymerase sigma-70 factor (ECF subfamily)